MVKIQAEVVNGKCPTCDQFTALVGLDKSFYDPYVEILDKLLDVHHRQNMKTSIAKIIAR